METTNYFISGKLAADIDKYTINEIGIPSVVLMERAALSVAEVTKKALSDMSDINEIFIFCGKGNNGADGLAAARILYQWGYKIRIFISGNLENVTEEFDIQKSIISKMNIDFKLLTNKEDVNSINFDKCSLVIDGLFGIGLSREISGLYYDLIKKINNQRSSIISIDIASGLDSLNGTVMGISVKADITVTFGYPKSGHILCDGKKYTGRLIVCDIGFCVPDRYYFDSGNNILNEDIFEAVTKDEIVKLPKREKTSNKGTYKTVNIIGAGENMSGAVVLAGEAAYRCGCGLVKIFASDNNINPVKCLLKEAVICGYDKLEDNYNNVFNSDKDIIVIGPGLSVSEKAEGILEKVLSINCKKIIDADALNIISRNKLLLEKLGNNTIITPHIKEMSRLIDKDSAYVRQNIIKCAREFSNKYKCTTIIKDATTVIAFPNGRVRINTSGNSGMSKGGSGDVLAGIIAGMISQGMDVDDAACLGVYIHGCAGDIAGKELSEYGMIASDIIKAIPKVLSL